MATDRPSEVTEQESLEGADIPEKKAAPVEDKQGLPVGA